MKVEFLLKSFGEGYRKSGLVKFIKTIPGLAGNLFKPNCGKKRKPDFRKAQRQAGSRALNLMGIAQPGQWFVIGGHGMDIAERYFLYRPVCKAVGKGMV